MTSERAFSCLEICAGGGGQSLGLEQAGFAHAAAVEIEPAACATLRTNRPQWDVREADVREVDGRDYLGVSLLAGGVPCPPFSIAGKGLGADDERDLFPEALRLVAEARPTAVMLENVKGLAAARFDDYRQQIIERLQELGYRSDWKVLNASEHGVPQLRPRFVLIALPPELYPYFEWPCIEKDPPLVGETLHDLMAADGWTGADQWAAGADAIAPTLVGGSRKHGGADLGPTRARAHWLRLGVDGRGVADAPLGADAPSGALPRLTLPMVARIQGFPDDWKFSGRKTAVYRQIGNAFPPPVAQAIGTELRHAITTPKESE